MKTRVTLAILIRSQQKIVSGRILNKWKQESPSIIFVIWTSKRPWRPQSSIENNTLHIKFGCFWLKRRNTKLEIATMESFPLSLYQTNIKFSTLLYQRNIKFSTSLYQRNIKFSTLLYQRNVKFSTILYQRNIKFSTLLYQRNIKFSSLLYQKHKVFYSTLSEKRQVFYFHFIREILLQYDAKEVTSYM